MSNSIVSYSDYGQELIAELIDLRVCGKVMRNFIKVLNRKDKGRVRKLLPGFLFFKVKSGKSYDIEIIFGQDLNDRKDGDIIVSEEELHRICQKHAFGAYNSALIESEMAYRNWWIGSPFIKATERFVKILIAPATEQKLSDAQVDAFKDCLKEKLTA